MTVPIPGVGSPPLSGYAPDEADGAEVMKRDVFISYSPDDKREAEEIVATLEGADVSCWIAPRDIPHGMEWPAPIIDAIFEAKLFLLVLSQSANRSAQMRREAQLAHDRHLPVLTVKIDGSEAEGGPGFPSRRQRLFVAAPLKPHLPRLVEEVRMLLGEKRVAPRF